MKIKIFTFQQDEIDILEDWIDYHAYLFGRENIYVINHQSEKSKELIKNKGVHLIEFSGPFLEKSRQLTDLMTKNKNSCDILIPVDVDEFILKQTEEDISCEKEEVTRCFGELGGCGVYKFSSYSVDRHDKDPLTEFTYVDDIPDHGRFERWKTFWKSNVFIKTDQGNHGFIGPYEKTNLALLHFHQRGFEHFKRKHLRWPISYGKNKPTGNNEHHWEKYYEKIKNMNEEQMLEYWKTLILNRGEHNSNRYQVFKDKIHEIRNSRVES